jgi:hypothetical protein
MTWRFTTFTLRYVTLHASWTAYSFLRKHYLKPTLSYYLHSLFPLTNLCTSPGVRVTGATALIFVKVGSCPLLGAPALTSVHPVPTRLPRQWTATRWSAYQLRDKSGNHLKVFLYWGLLYRIRVLYVFWVVWNKVPRHKLCSVQISCHIGVRNKEQISGDIPL